MGKNQQHKAMQRGRHGSDDADPAAAAAAGEEGADVSFHTPAWHAARIAALTVERVPYEDWKKKQKEEAATRQAADEDEERQMREPAAA
ncbi:hypothetical protein WJX73_002307 [Symbiochloris irregularis]|uniref:Uncharacterized protein n=1 Tax=Symbiochloris irregularis TaxID=706552 RepID=A0AAW1P8A8_9CHLO